MTDTFPQQVCSNAPQTPNGISPKAQGGTENGSVNCYETRGEKGTASGCGFGQTEELHDDMPSVRDPREIHCGRTRLCNMHQLQSHSKFQVWSSGLGGISSPTPYHNYSHNSNNYDHYKQCNRVTCISAKPPTCGPLRCGGRG